MVRRVIPGQTSGTAVLVPLLLRWSDLTLIFKRQGGSRVSPLRHLRPARRRPGSLERRKFVRSRFLIYED